MSDSATLASRALDLTARVLDLTSVLSQASSLTGGLLELGQWLALERVDRNELYEFFDKARGLVYANQTGQDFYNEIASAESINKNRWPLSVKQAGSLGRLIIKDPHLAWIISTTACLFQFHNSVFISETVGRLITLADPANKDIPESQLRLLPCRVDLKVVVDRIVESAWFNVVNSGTNTAKLPDKLATVCARGHHLSSDKLGIVIHALKENREKVVIESTHLLKNLAMWLYIHFQGKLIVSVSGKVEFEEDLGNSDRVVELKVKKYCGKDDDCTKDEDSYRLIGDVKGSYEEFLSGTYPSGFDMPETPMVRRSLDYNVMKAYDIGARVLSNVVKVEINQCAQAMVKWLMLLPLDTIDGGEFGFSIPNLDVNAHKSANHLQVLGTVLGQSPSILNMNYGALAEWRVVYSPPPPFCSEDELREAEAYVLANPDDDSMVWDAIDEIDEDFHPYNKHTAMQDALGFSEDNIVKSFPLLKDLVVSARSDCQCSHCLLIRNKGVESRFRLPVGCKGYVAVAAVLLSISHAVAESFGAPDISGMGYHIPPLNAIVNLFAEILLREQVTWNSLFSVAACVYTGCPFVGQETLDTRKAGERTIAAIQYGNLSVIAPWLDLTKKQNIERCFRFNVMQGKLGVMRDYNGKQQFRGIPEQFAIVNAERTEDTSNFNDRFEKVSELATASIAIQRDDSEFTSEITLVTAGTDVYLLWIRIRSDTFVRIIDPVDSLIQLARSILVVKCKHKSNANLLEHPQGTVKLYDFDELLGRWQCKDTFCHVNDDSLTRFSGKKTEDDTPGLTFHVTSILQHEGMINVARALTVKGMVVVTQGASCISCAIDEAKVMPLPKLPRQCKHLDVRDRYIINTKADYVGNILVHKKSRISKYNVDCKWANC